MTLRRPLVLMLVTVLIVLALPALTKVISVLRPATYATETYTTANLRTSSGIHLVVPQISKVTSLRIVFGALGSEPPTPLSANTSRNRAIIIKVVDWLKQSKPLGYERIHPTLQTIPPTVAEMTLADGRHVVLQPAMNSIIGLRNGQLRTEKDYYAKNDVDFVSGNRTIRIYSPGLYRWISLGEWVKDIPWHPRSKRER